VSVERDRDPAPFIGALIRQAVSEHERRYHPEEKVITITSDANPAFCAGVVLRDGAVIRAAPIVRYMTGWTEDGVSAYAARRGWSVLHA
jgi:hypothetical protein